MFCQSLGPSLNRGSTSQSPTGHFPNKNNGCLFASLIFLSLPLFTYFTLNNTFYLLCAFCLFHISPFSTHLSYTSFSVWVMHKSIPDAPSPPPPLSSRATAGHCFGSPFTFQSRGWGICKFCAARSFWHERGFLSEYNYTEDIYTGKKACWLICQGQGVVKACSLFYACISSLLIKPKLHSETRELSTWINVFG